jgi:hypothetical protein
VSGGPVLFDVALDADFSLGAFLAQHPTGNGANWSAGFIDFALLSGTRIYYYDEAADDSAHSHSTLDGITFQPGFNVDAQIRLTQVTSITLHGVLTVRTDRTAGANIGVQVRIRIDNSRDLVLAQIASTTQPAPGPALHKRPGARHLDLPADRVPAARQDQLPGVGVSKGSDGGTIMKGTLTAAQPLAPFSARWAAASPTPATRTPTASSPWTDGRISSGVQPDRLRGGDQGPGRHQRRIAVRDAGRLHRDQRVPQQLLGLAVGQRLRH